MDDWMDDNMAMMMLDSSSFSTKALEEEARIMKLFEPPAWEEGKQVMLLDQNSDDASDCIKRNQEPSYAKQDEYFNSSDGQGDDSEEASDSADVVGLARTSSEVCTTASMMLIDGHDAWQQSDFYNDVVILQMEEDEGLLRLGDDYGRCKHDLLEEDEENSSCQQYHVTCNPATITPPPPPPDEDTIFEDRYSSAAHDSEMFWKKYHDFHNATVVSRTGSATSLAIDAPPSLCSSSESMSPPPLMDIDSDSTTDSTVDTTLTTTGSTAGQTTGSATRSTNLQESERSTNTTMETELFQTTLKKLAESMKRSQETRESLMMKTEKTEKYHRSACVSKVLKSIEISSRQLDSYFKNLERASL